MRTRQWTPGVVEVRAGAVVGVGADAEELSQGASLTRLLPGNTRLTSCMTTTLPPTARSLIVATPLWPSVGVKPNTWKSWELESIGTPECSELDRKGQNTSYWGVLSVVGKVLKRRYRKCPRIGNSDIYKPSYGQKKGRGSNWQFDSRPLNVGNRPLPNVRFQCATWR
jgi:hypothetical protein